MLKDVNKIFEERNNIPFVKLTDIEGVEVKIRTISYEGGKYHGVCDIPDDLIENDDGETITTVRIVFPARFAQIISEAISKKMINLNKVNETVIFKSEISKNGNPFWSFKFV